MWFVTAVSLLAIGRSIFYWTGIMTGIVKDSANHACISITHWMHICDISIWNWLDSNFSHPQILKWIFCPIQNCVYHEEKPRNSNNFSLLIVDFYRDATTLFAFMSAKMCECVSVFMLAVGRSAFPRFRWSLDAFISESFVVKGEPCFLLRLPYREQSEVVMFQNCYAYRWNQ